MISINKKKVIQIILFTGTFISLFFVPWSIINTWLPPLPNTIQEQIDDSVSQSFDGIIVYIDEYGKTPQYLASGWHNKELNIPAKPDALFQIASISKLYDALAITKLVNNGFLSLDKTIADYLPELIGRIENTEKITLRLLLQHRSGIPNFTDTPDFWSNPTKNYDQSLELILDKASNFEPDEKYEYCNTNFLIINKIMDKILTYNNFQFIKTDILSPLGLENTFESLNDVNISSVMSGYHVDYPYDLKKEGQGMIASAEDVGIFLRALNNGKIFNENEQKIYSSVYKYEHSGWIPGYQSFAIYIKEIDTVLITFYNTTDSKLYNWNLSEIINSRIIKILKKQNKKAL